MAEKFILQSCACKLR